MKTKNLVLILVVVLAVVILGVVFGMQKKEVKEPAVENDQLTETATTTEVIEISEIDTSNWKTYRNEELKFEVMIPNNWKVVREGVNEIFFNSSLSFNFPPKEVGYTSWIDLSEEVIKIGKLDARKMTYIIADDSQGNISKDKELRYAVLVQWFKGGGDRLDSGEISFMYSESKKEKSEKVLDEIIKSFKFLK